MANFPAPDAVEISGCEVGGSPVLKLVFNLDGIAKSPRQRQRDIEEMLGLMLSACAGGSGGNQ